MQNRRRFSYALVLALLAAAACGPDATDAVRVQADGISLTAHTEPSAPRVGSNTLWL